MSHSQRATALVTPLELDEEALLLDRLSTAVGSEIVAQAEHSLSRLEEQCKRRPLADSHILLAFGGGKDSSWTLAYVRLMQLILKARLGRTFHLHTIFVAHPGVPPGVFENVRCVLAALGADRSGDLRVVSTTLGGVPVPLEFGAIGDGLTRAFKQEVLVGGHLAQGNGRETFCNGCNFLMVGGVARYIVEQGGTIDWVITGDSRNEVVLYWKWVQKTARSFGLERIEKERASWSSFFGKMSEISESYYLGLLGERDPRISPHVFPNVEAKAFEPPNYFCVFEETRYEYWMHEHVLTDFLGFRLREDSFNFTESDCRNPMLMAHLRGLLADFEGRGYISGVREYLRLATFLMERKAYSSEMIALALDPYRDDAGILQRGREAEEHAQRQYGITADQLRGMVASPVADEMVRLEAFMQWNYPAEVELSPSVRRYLEALRDSTVGGLPADWDDGTFTSRVGQRFVALGGTRAEFDRARTFVDRALGLTLRSLSLLLPRRTVSREAAGACGSTELEIMRLGDPHQMKLSEQPGTANNLITGR